MNLNAITLAITRPGGVRAARPWDPLYLFLDPSTQGVWYDPSDLTTLFQDAAGTTPVTAVEQPVGLMLDKRNTAYSTYFDGAGDYLTAVNGGNFEFGVNNFTVECWIYNSSVSGSTGYAGVWSSGAQSWILYRDSNTYKFFHTNPSTSFSFTTSAVTGEWTHIAVVRDGATIKAYVNGIASGSLSIGATVIPVYNSTPLCIGANLDPFPSAYLTGYISNLRIVKGTALYTANFTPPTAPLTAVTGTSLLTCGTTWSGNPAITTVGNTRADKLNPFKTGTGNHAYNQAGSSGSFPRLSALYNLLTKTEQFDDAVWKTFGTVSKSGTTVCSVAFTSDAGGAIYAETIGTNSVSQTYNITVKARAVTAGKKIRLGIFNGVVNIQSSDISLTSDFAEYTFTTSATTLTGTPSWFVKNESGGGVGTIEFKEPTFISSNDALNQPAYQRVNTSSDYDTVGFKPYLKFNGANQWLQTNSIDFTYGDKMFVSAGARKLRGSQSETIVALSSDPSTIDGSFYLVNSEGTAGATSWALRGTALARAITAAATTPLTEVNSVRYDIAGAGRPNEIFPRINGADVSYSGAGTNAGTGNFGNYPIYIGAYGGTGVFFNGRLYGLVVAGKQASDTELLQTEDFMELKTFNKDMSWVYDGMLTDAAGNPITDTAGNQIYTSLTYQ